MVTAHKFRHVNDACNAADALFPVFRIFGVEILAARQR